MTSDKAPTTKYQAAIMGLNSLQSNAMTIQKMRESRASLQEQNVPQTINFLVKCGISMKNIDNLHVIHVSGTKGKGSTCAFVESMLRSLGLKTGLYTSPHLIHARERIRINSQPISEETFAKHFFDVYDKLSQDTDVQMPAYFKFLTLMAFHVFLEEKVDVAIIEVGIGGTYDCTNVIQNPVACGITTLDIDHTSILGSTLPEIAWHKAGICKAESPCFVTPPSQEAMEVIEKRANEFDAPLIKAPQFSDYQWPEKGISAGIEGDHQKVNVALALQLVRQWVKSQGLDDKVFPENNSWKFGDPFIVPDVFVEAIQNCRWPGRSQIVETSKIRYYLDGAHTPKSMQMCSEWFGQALKDRNRRRILVFQCTADRNPLTLLSYLNEHSFDYALFSPTIITVSQDKCSDISNFNQSTSDQLARSNLCAQIWHDQGNKGSEVFDCVSSLVEWLNEKSKEDDLDVLVTGSLHLVGGVLSLISSEVA
ncbi:unnamed protein product [Auanema sp. JU1783]|nr:unnamed protein product [Auanema sp. JU1783]